MTFTAQILILYPESFPEPLGMPLAGTAIDMHNYPVIVQAELVQ